MRIAGSFVFAFLCWSAVIAGLASRACTPEFNLNVGLLWLEIYTLMGYVVSIPAVLIGAGATYVVSRTLLASRPRTQRILFVLIPGAVFAICVSLSHEGRCVYP
jgi:hypothetical protein